MTTKRRGNKLSPAQSRAARRARRQNRRKLLRWTGGVAVALIAVAFILSLILPSIPFGTLFDGGPPDGPGSKIEDQGRTHIPLGQEHPPYNSVPATSGWHYPVPLAPVRWGIHSDFIPEEKRVHNLEHGGIGIEYNCPEGCVELVDNLSQLVDVAVDGGLKVVLSPYPSMDTRIALTAWNFIDQFDVFDEERIKAFIDAHESSPNAPEANAR